MTGVTILAVGPRHDPQLQASIEELARRLERRLPVTWLLLPYSKAEGPAARRAESDAMLTKLKDSDIVVLLDERGRQLTSEAFARHIEQWTGMNKRLVFVIGGAYGVSDALQARADMIWSLSSLVFPHQVVRLILVEQLYRATAILDGHPYHHQ